VRTHPANVGAPAGMDAPSEFLNAKLRGRRRRVYEGDRLEELARQGSVEDLARRLYPRETIAGRLGLERRLRQDCANELAGVVRYLSGGIRRFYIALIRRFQVENITVLLRLFAGDREEPSPEQYLMDLPEWMSAAGGELLASADPAEFIARLPADLSKAAAAAHGAHGTQQTTAFIEMALERQYWQGVVESLRGLPAACRSECAVPILSELGAARLLAVLRAARHTDLAWEDLLGLIPAWKGSGEDGPHSVLLQGLHRDASAGNVASKLPGLTVAEAENLADLEHLVWGRTFRLANRLYYRTTSGPAVVVGYYYVRRHELKALTALVESVHYGRPSSVTR